MNPVAAVAAVVLTVDAVVALAATVLLALPVFFQMTDFEAGPGLDHGPQDERFHPRRRRCLWRLTTVVDRAGRSRSA